ncbi:MAG: DUF721 domain-containing protein [Candidatus Zixiibacteriota bacterium]
MGKPTAIGTILRQRLAALGVARRVKEASVETRWAEVVGPEIAAHTHVAKLEAGRLIVSVDEPAWRQELLYQREAIVAKLNRDVGEDETIVREILFTGPEIARRKADSSLRSE